MTQPVQLTLFPTRNLKGERGKPLSAPVPELTAQSSLAAAMGGFEEYLLRQERSPNTIKSMRSDLRLLGQRLGGGGRKIGQIGRQDLDDFLAWLQHGRGVACSPKSQERRISTLKAFFGWLAQAGIILDDPAASLPYKPASSPLPDILYEEEVQRVLAAAGALAPDPRPELLVRLLLATGIKKAECMAIRPGHIDRSDPTRPVLYVRHSGPKVRWKERKLKLPAELLPILDRYLAHYQPRESLFECTPRTLEYVLQEVAGQAGLAGGLSFQKLRWTCAVRDYQAGMPPGTLRQKLGLSTIAWAKALPKIEKLAGPAL